MARPPSADAGPPSPDRGLAPHLDPRDTGPRDTGPRNTGPRDTGPRDTDPRDTGRIARPLRPGRATTANRLPRGGPARGFAVAAGQAAPGSAPAGHTARGVAAGGVRPDPRDRATGRGADRPEPYDSATAPVAERSQQGGAHATTVLPAGIASGAATEATAAASVAASTAYASSRTSPASASSRPVPGVPPLLPERARHAAPPPARYGRGRRVARALSWIAVAMSVTTLLTAAVGYAFVRHYNGNISRLGGIFSRPGGPAGATASGPMNILLVGSDSRANLPPGQDFQGVGAERVVGQRSDTIILAHLYGNDDVAQLISMPRDSWVTIPAYTDPTTGKTTPAHVSKINSAMEEGGPALLVKTVEQLTGVQIDHYVQIDFAGFKSMVDALGGVEVCLPKAEKEPKSGINLPAGRSIVQGDQALAYVRQRHGLPRGDIDRVARQQQFIGAIVRKTLSAGTLTNPFKLNSFLNAATKAVQVDDRLNINGLRDLALRMRNFTSGGVVFSTLPVAKPDAFRDGQSVVLLDDAAMAKLFDAVKRDVPPGKAAPAPSPATAVLTVAPQDVQVRVFNGADINGLAGRAAGDLQQVGFNLAGPPGNRPSGAASSVVLYGPGKQDAAATLAAAVPGATTKLDNSLTTTLQLVVGADYSGARPVQVGQPAPAAPAPPVSPSPAQTTTAAVDACAV